MLGSIVCLFTMIDAPIPADNRANAIQLIENKHSEFFGSLDLNEEGDLCFFHFPEGEVKIAVLYVHKLSFEKRSDKIKAYKSVGKNVKISGSVLKIKDIEILLVNKLEILSMEI
jgi:hypothetical protein